jgi:hypothetical protein
MIWPTDSVGRVCKFLPTRREAAQLPAGHRREDSFALDFAAAAQGPLSTPLALARVLDGTALTTKTMAVYAMGIVRA